MRSEKDVGMGWGGGLWFLKETERERERLKEKKD